MKWFAWMIAGVAGMLILGNTRAQDPALVDAKHYRVELENDQVRVLRVHYGPGERSVMHAHPNALAVFLTNAYVKFTAPDNTSQLSSNKAGTVIWTPAAVHLPQNIGTEPFEVILVELKTASVGIPIMPKLAVDPAIKRRVEKELNIFTRTLGEKKSLEKPDLFGLLTEYLKQDPDVYGAAFAFTPQVRGGVLVKSAPYVYRHADVYVEKDLIENYDYTAPEQEWYARPVREGKPSWSKPYYDKGGSDAWMITYSVPLYDTEHQLLGVVRNDVLLPIQ